MFVAFEKIVSGTECPFAVSLKICLANLLSSLSGSLMVANCIVFPKMILYILVIF